MSDIAIKVEGISKKFVIGKNVHSTLRSSLSNLFSKRSHHQDFYALKEVSFEVLKGEALGIIGKNGAGKSTLLKILSKITDPTEGRAVIEGKVASLLEVGTGFHPELTGRENIYLNGSLLGMSKVEIDDQFDNIVEFSGIDKFIDTPVKRYSSGMYVRLAFAVAAHLNSEILLVDEVLAVGDYEFRKKCLSKMESLSKGSSKTLLFVSHNLNSIEALCKRSILLENGKIKAFGLTRDIIDLYKREVKNDQSKKAIDSYRQAKRSQEVKLVSIQLEGNKKIINKHEELVFEMEIESKVSFKNLLLEFFLFNENGEKLAELFSWDSGTQINIDNESLKIRFSIGVIPLLPGSYFADIRIKNALETSALDYIERLPIFDVGIEGSNEIKVKMDRKGILSIVPKVEVL